LVNRGEIWWADHPEAGRRPVCVLTRQAAIEVLPGVLVAPATRTVRGIPTEVALTASEDGMPQDCALSFDNLATVPQSLLTDRITQLREPRLGEICDALRVATGC
jgi:mRNA interferase MazF